MLAENFVVKGTFFQIKWKDEEWNKFLDRVKFMLIENLKSKGYFYNGPDSFFYKYLEMNFDIIIPKNESILQYIPFLKKRFEYHSKYFEKLKNTRNDIPWHVKIYLYAGKFKDTDGLFIEITSEPAIFYKIVQVNSNIFIDNERYRYIVYTSTEFIDGIAKSLACTSIKEPKPLLEYIKTEVSEKLKAYNFDKIADLLDKGRKEIELGKTENGLVDLRASIENFLFDLINGIGEKPHPLHQPENNINLLEKIGYLDGKTKGLMIKVLYNGIYQVLSDTTHKRENVNLFDARLYFNLTEQTFDYLLEKIMRYKIKNVSGSS